MADEQTCRSRCLDEAGVSLIELLMSVAIMGIAFAVMIGGMWTYTQSASIHATQADVGLYGRQYAEAMANIPYAPCVSSYTMPAAGPPAPNGISSVNSVLLFDDNTSSFSISPASCAGSLTDARLQRIRTVTTATTGYSVTIDVVKRAP